MVPGGRIELPTPAFSGLRSTNELPRHGANKHYPGERLARQRESRKMRKNPARGLWDRHSCLSPMHSVSPFRLPVRQMPLAIGRGYCWIV